MVLVVICPSKCIFFFRVRIILSISLLKHIVGLLYSLLFLSKMTCFFVSLEKNKLMQSLGRQQLSYLCHFCKFLPKSGNFADTLGKQYNNRERILLLAILLFLWKNLTFCKKKKNANIILLKFTSIKPIWIFQFAFLKYYKNTSQFFNKK